MKPENYTDALKQSLGTQLKAVILYGSAVTGDFIENRSDYNLLILADDWSQGNLQSIREATQKWISAGNPAPLCFTSKRLIESRDVFPMEMMDILDAHKVLYGDDLITGLQIDPTHLRHQVEFELRSKLLKLRQAYLQITKPKKALPLLMSDSLSSFLSVFKGALRLYQAEVPTDKLQATHVLGQTLDLSTEVFDALNDLKTKGGQTDGQSSEALFESYLTTIETVLDRIDTVQND